MPDVIWAYTPDPIEVRAIGLAAWLHWIRQLGVDSDAGEQRHFRLQSRRHTEITPAEGPDGESNEA